MDAWILQALDETPHGAHRGHDVSQDEGGATVRCSCGVSLTFAAPPQPRPKPRRIVVTGGPDGP